MTTGMGSSLKQGDMIIPRLHLVASGRSPGAVTCFVPIAGDQPRLLRIAVNSQLTSASASLTRFWKLAIQLSFCPELARLSDSGKISVRNHGYETGDTAGTFLAIAATDDSEINRQVAEEAQSKAILVNVVDDAGNSDFIAPSYLRREGLTIAVSTSGQSPALARKIRTILEKEITKQYGTLTHIIGEVRSEIRREGIKIEDDRWQEAMDLDLLLELLQKGERGKAKAILLSRLKEKRINV